MKVRIYNTFHNTEITTGVEPYLEGAAKQGEYLSELGYYAQQQGGKDRAKHQRILRKLCGIKGCCCGGMIREEII